VPMTGVGKTATVLALFTLAASFAGHAYWAVPAEQMFVQKLIAESEI